MKRATSDQITTDISSGVVYQTHGSVPASARRRAEQMMSEMARLAPNNVDSCRVKLKHDADRIATERFVAQANMEIGDALVRAQAAGATAGDALKAVADRLERKLSRIGDGGRRTKHRPPSTRPKSGRPANEAPRHLHHRSLPPEHRSIVRRKTCPAGDAISLREAFLALELRDYAFYLFTDDADGKITIVYDSHEGPVARKVDGSKPPAGAAYHDIKFIPSGAPDTTVADAVSRLNESDSSFSFFVDSDRRQPSVLYRRLDGHYGLVVPSPEMV